MTVTTRKLTNILEGYGKLHDGLSDMIESGRLNESAIPDDYVWLVNTLERLSNDIDRAKDLLATRDKRMADAIGLLGETLNKWEDEEDSVQEEKADHIADLKAFFTECERRPV